MSNTSKKFLLEKVSNNTNKKDNTLCFKLYKDGNYIKTYTPEKSNQLNKYIKSNNIEGKIIGKSIWYDNEEIMKLIISNNKTKNKKINKRKLKRRKLIFTITTLTVIAIIGLSNIKKEKGNNKVSTNVSTNEIDISKDNEILNNKKAIEENVIFNKNLPLNTINLNSFYEINTNDLEIIDKGFENIYEFSDEDRTNNGNRDVVNNNYSSYIETYSRIYGIDSKLITAIICQENPDNNKNYDMDAGHGISQIEGIWQDQVIYAFNNETNSWDSSGPIDVIRCTNDPEYSIKIETMMLNNYYNILYNDYSYKFSNEEILGAAVFAYNKGITTINNALNNSDTYNEFLDYIKNYSYGGDNKYIEHVFSYINDEDVITLKTSDGKNHNILIDNINVNGKKKNKKF